MELDKLEAGNKLNKEIADLKGHAGEVRSYQKSEKEMMKYLMLSTRSIRDVTLREDFFSMEEMLEIYLMRVDKKIAALESELKSL